MGTKWDSGCNFNTQFQYLVARDARSSQGENTPIAKHTVYTYYFNFFLDELWRRFNSLIENFCENYAVYHYFRSKGWVVKDGTKFGVNFLLYQEGPAYYHAQYSVKIATEV